MQGPTLPPHLLPKRKRDEDDEKAIQSISSSKSCSPTAEPDGSKRQRVAGPAMQSPGTDVNEFRKKVDNSSSESSSDEDDYGPALPSATLTGQTQHSVFDDEVTKISGAKEMTRRDEWMTMPPTQDDLSARMDPTKQRARGFNTGKGAKGPPDGGNAMWTETPEQRRQRLKDQVMGVDPADAPGMKGTKDLRRRREDQEKARMVKEHNKQYRGESLYTQHQGAARSKEEDDPSKRAFDYEKDIGSGSKISHTQRREMLNKASDFGSRFSSGKYL